MDLKNLLDLPPWQWPRDTASRFRKVLTDPRAEAGDRLVAAELAGDFTVVNDDLARALLGVLGNPAESVEMRSRAAISLGPALEQAYTDEFDDPDSVPISEPMYGKIKAALEKIFRDLTTPKEVRRRVLEAAVRSPEDWQRDAIRTAYASGDPEWRLTAVFGMRWVKGFQPQILEALSNPDPETLAEAVEAAGSWSVVEAWPRVVTLLSNPGTDKHVLLAAIEAAAAIHPEEARTVLLELTQSPDEDIAEAAEEAMMMASAAGEDLDDEDNPYDEDDDEDEEEDGGTPGRWVN